MDNFERIDDAPVITPSDGSASVDAKELEKLMSKEDQLFTSEPQITG